MPDMDSPASPLVKAVTALLARGDTDDLLALNLLNLLRGRPRLPSARQREIGEMLLEGCDNKEIAKRLNLSVRTVKAHFSGLFRRYGITGTVGRGRANGRVRLALLLYRRRERGESW